MCNMHRYDILICCPLGQSWAANDVWQDCWIGYHNKAVPRDVQPARHIALVRLSLICPQNQLGTNSCQTSTCCLQPDQSLVSVKHHMPHLYMPPYLLAKVSHIL